ncbi:MAG: exopolysaccharide biosynthesis protein [Pseudomonadota bacterium]
MVTNPNMTIRPLSALFDDILALLKDEKISIKALLEAFHERCFGFFLFLFALPAAIPLPGLGINTIIALPLLLLTGQIALGRHTVWMPNFIEKKEFASDSIKGAIEKTTPWLEKIEMIVAPRLGFMTSGIGSKLVGLMAFVMAISVAIPLPLTNTVPSFGLAVIGIGLMMRDGLAILGGLAVGIGWVTLLTVAVIFVGAESAEMIKEFINNYFFGGAL